MIQFHLNGAAKTYRGDDRLSLLGYLRKVEGITSTKDGCSGQGACGACLVEVNGSPRLACATPMAKLQQARITTIQGFPARLRRTLGQAFVAKGAVQCGFARPASSREPRYYWKTIRSPAGKRYLRP